MTQPIASIEKEEIPRLKFPKYEVLKSRDEQLQRRADLEKAMVLGNSEHGKIRIIFECTEGLKMVETTVWAVDDEELSLKAGLSIPLHVIHKVQL